MSGSAPIKVRIYTRHLTPDPEQWETSLMTSKLCPSPKTKDGRSTQQDTRLRLEALHHRILVLETTTSCVEMVLLGQHYKDPTEIVTLMVQNIADELGLIGEAIELLIGARSAGGCRARRHRMSAGRQALSSTATVRGRAT